MQNGRRISRPSLDAADHQILNALNVNARISMADLGRLLGMSPQSAADRLRRLEDLGVVSGFSVKLDREMLGLTVGAYIRIRPAMGELPRVKGLLADIPEIVECDRITGDDCFIAKVFVARIEDLERVIDRLIPYAQTNTSIIQSSPVRLRAPKCG
jgi:Lrp/AsnC family transcriptional regulator, leucine-responsive regulatory protein